MLTKPVYKIAAAAVGLLLLVGLGFYMVGQQKDELQRVQDAEKVARLKRAEIASLVEQQAETQQQAEDVLRRWYARYKVVPATQTNPEVVGFLNNLSQSGFENFDVIFRGQSQNPDYSYLTYSIDGRGYFNSLYRFIWEVENHRDLYRIRGLRLNHIDLIKQDKETETERMQVMVSFTFDLEAYFGGSDGMSVQDVGPTGGLEGLGVVPVELPTVPSDVLPNKRPDINPFFPVIMERIPPNTHGLIDVEVAELTSIVGGKAVFSEATGFRAVGVGDAVYLGQVIEIDPLEDRVVVRLNKGGIIDEVELRLQTGERFRQATGAARLVPIE